MFWVLVCEHGVLEVVYVVDVDCGVFVDVGKGCYVYVLCFDGGLWEGGGVGGYLCVEFVLCDLIGVVDD